jgi:hypothetical protein
MVENRAVSDGTNEAQSQPKQLAVRFAPEIIARIEADAAARDANPTEIVRTIICEHYSGANQEAGVIRELRELIEDRFRHLVYEISRTRSSLYNIVEQGNGFGLDRPKLKQIQQWSREDASEYLGRLDAEMRRRIEVAKAGGEVSKE